MSQGSRDAHGGGGAGAGVWPAALRRLVLVKRGEGEALAWSAAYFFLLLFSYYLQRPLRDAMGIRGDLDRLPWLWTGTTAAMLVAVPVFAYVVSRVPRRRFLPMLYRFFALNLVVFFLAFQLAGEGNRTAVGYAYYVWLSVYNLFQVSVFWGFMADLFRPEQGKRLFATIAVGGTLGATLGAAVPATLVEGVALPGIGTVSLAPTALLPIAVATLEMARGCVVRLMRIGGVGGEGAGGGGGGGGDGGGGGEVAAAPREPGRGVWTGIALVARSPYLAALAVYMLIFTVTSTFVWFEQLAIVKGAFEDDRARTAFFGRLDVTVNALTLLAQLLVTGRIMRWVGVGTALAVLPVVTGAGFALLAAEPTLWAFSAFYVLRRAAHYAVDRPSREVLYTVLGPEEKYKSKVFIDTFVYRGGDLLGAWTHGLAAAMAGGLTAVVVPLSVVWAGTAVFLGAKNRRLVRGAGGCGGGEVSR